LVIATTKLIFALGMPLLLLARSNHIPLYVKPLGADLDFWLKNQKKFIQRCLVRALSMTNGVFVQTRQLQSELLVLGCKNVSYVPGYRPAVQDQEPKKKTGKQLRLVFLSQIYREKGAFLLLDTLSLLRSEKEIDMICDFYGPIIDEDRCEFLQKLQETSCAHYIGIADVGTASQIMKNYDILVFPTLRTVEEGYPGVIIEAMQAGIPVISTKLQSISELITDQENGFLIQIGDSNALARAIKQLDSDSLLREKMGKNNLLKSQAYRADRVIYRMLHFIFPSLEPSFTD
jgi:glycosyltransferase involved in cell wall biosynthesis